jgi:hypothetical protein
MKRSNFLKLIATMVVAPTLMGDVTIKPVKDENQPIQNIEDRIRFFSNDAAKCMLGDIIVSDMGDRAMITTVVHYEPKYVEARPIIRGQYRFKTLENFHVFARSVPEQNHINN